MCKISPFFRFVRIYGMVIMFDLELHIKGFSKTFEDFKKNNIIQYPLNSEIAFNLISKEIFDFFEMLDIVCAWYPRKADCVHKTFIGYKVMRRKYKIPVDMVVGVRKFPFEAHAWLKSGERNLFGDEVDTDRYKIVLKSSYEGNIL